jgi:SpoVK/Ycf46/Vps4 family AAA+-type ATPase
MNQEEQNVIETLQDRIEDYERILQEMIKGARGIGTVISGPHLEDENKFYRLRMSGGGGDIMSLCIIEDAPNIEHGSEVLVTEGSITRILPEKLSIIKDPPPFEHIGWDKVGGLKSQIESIRRSIEGPITKMKHYKDFGIEPSRGALLYGPPGCGKTLISKVIASMIIDKQKGTSESFVYVKGPELLNSLVGASEEAIRRIFNDCRKLTKKTGSKCVVFIDEAESLLSRRGSGISSDINNTIVPQFLSEMDGFDEDSPFILLATNLPNALDSAVIREGRIDLKIEIQRPTEDDAKEIFEIHLKKLKLHDKIDVLTSEGSSFLYEKGRDISGAMIKTIANEAAQIALFRWLDDNKKQPKGVTVDDMKLAILKIVNTQVLDLHPGAPHQRSSMSRN